MGLTPSAGAPLLVWGEAHSSGWVPQQGSGAQETPQQGLNLRLSFHHGPDNGLDELPVIPRPGLLQRSLYDRRDLRLLTGQSGSSSPKTNLGCNHPKNAQKSHKQMSDKTGGPDGLTAPMLKNLSETQIEEMAGHLNSWELTGEMPQAVTTSVVAMLPKKIDKERPIALTSMAYRAWCKVRWDKFQQWSAEYSVTSPWDRAQKGSSSLDISLKRLITYEGIRARQRHGITLLLDLKEFYEHVDLDSLITQASCHGFPAVLLQGALQVYIGPRYIQGESCLSAPVRAERGIMAGCPFAVGLSKLALHPVMQELWRHPALSHLDLFVDDSGYDVEHHNPEKCASNAYRIWKEVQAQFKKIDMPVSIKKTAWVCSSKQLEDKLTGYLGPGDPTIQPLWSDLGVDCAAGKRRRVTQHRQRIAKGKQRAARLAKLQAGRKPTMKANRASIMGAALYGHEAVGLGL